MAFPLLNGADLFSECSPAGGAIVAFELAERRHVPLAAPDEGSLIHRRREEGEMSPVGPSVWTGRALQAESDDLEKLVLRFCIRPIDGAFELLAIMDIRARSISFTTRPRRPYGPPDHERAGETFSPSPLSNSQTSAGKPTLAFGSA